MRTITILAAMLVLSFTALRAQNAGEKKTVYLAVGPDEVVYYSEPSEDKEVQKLVSWTAFKKLFETAWRREEDSWTKTETENVQSIIFTSADLEEIEALTALELSEHLKQIRSLSKPESF